MTSVISPELFEFVESGISILVGTRNDLLLPDCCRAVGARVEADGAELTVFVPVAASSDTVPNLHDNSRIAVCFSRARDHKSVQVKGRMTSVTEAGEADRCWIQRYRHGLAESWGVIGIPPRVTLRIAHWPCWAIRLRVEAVFNQTPGPGAGAAFGVATPA